MTTLRFALLSLLFLCPIPAEAGEPSTSEKARGEGFEDRVEAEREDHVDKAIEAAKSRATPTPARTPPR